jgi:DNA-binding transcriptional regulator LsrR (DeoR family)
VAAEEDGNPSDARHFFGGGRMTAARRELEARRKLAWQGFANGWKRKQVAKTLGVSQALYTLMEARLKS